MIRLIFLYLLFVLTSNFSNSFSTIYGTGVALETLSNIAASGTAPSEAVKTALQNAKQIFDLIVEGNCKDIPAHILDQKTGVAYFEDADTKDTNIKVSAQFFSGLSALASQLKANVQVNKV
jgi:hypothetical protein